MNPIGHYGKAPAIRAAVMASLAGGLLAMAFPPVDIGWVAPVGVAVFLEALHGAGGRRAALLGGLAGIVFFGALLSWSAIFGVVAWIALVLSQAAFFAALAVGLARALRMPSLGRRVVAIAGVWAAVELVRGRFPLGGFPWGLLGVSQHSFGPGRATVAWIGTVGLSALLAGMGVLLWETARRFRVSRIGSVRPLLGLAGLVLVQVAAVAAPSPPEGPAMRVAVVQGGVEPGSVAPEQELSTNESIHERLTLDAARKEPDLIVWGEDVLDLGRYETPAIIGELSNETGIPIIAGYVRDAPGERFENVVGLFDREPFERQRYVKQRPVPFGEYVPLRSLLDWYPPLKQVPRDMVRGGFPTVFRLSGGPTVGSFISFESTFPDLGGALVSRGASLLVVNTNNASFRRSALARQHLAADQMRAAEQGRYLIRAAITGISAFIDPDGQVMSTLPIYEKGVLFGTVRPITRRTPYGITGDWPVRGLAAIGIVPVFGPRRRRRPDASERTESQPIVLDAAGGDLERSVQS